MGAVAAAAVVRRERRIVDAYRNAGAIVPERARTPDELLTHQGLAFDRLTRRAVLRDAGGGRYYLDEPSWRALVGLRRRLALVAVLIGLIVASGVLAAAGVLSR